MVLLAAGLTPISGRIVLIILHGAAAKVPACVIGRIVIPMPYLYLPKFWRRKKRIGDKNVNTPRALLAKTENVDLSIPVTVGHLA